MSSVVLQPVVGCLQRTGADTDAILRRAGIDPGVVGTPELEMHHGWWRGLWSAAIEVTGDPAIGLHAAEHVEPGIFRVFDYAVRTNRTLGEAIGDAKRYAKLLSPMLRIELLQMDGRAHLRHSLAFRGLNTHSGTEFVLGATLVMGRQMGVAPGGLAELRCAYPDPGYREEYERLFQSPVRFNTAHTEMVFNERALTQALPNSDERLASVVREHADSLLTSEDYLAEFPLAVREVILQELTDGNPSAEHVAETLNVSPRTLRRRLRDMGVSFQQLVDQVRYDLATQSLRGGQHSVAKVGEQLGFSSAAAFSKAFKRWAGVSPEAYRRYAMRVPDASSMVSAPQAQA